MSPTFADLGVPPALVALLADRGIDAPFPVQVATIPDALAGRDLCGKAPTGSGKTLAFGIPLVLRTTLARPGRPTSLVLVPTRELAAQVSDELAALGRPFGHRVVSVYGGVALGPQIDRLSKGAAIVVACPGRLLDLIRQDALRLDAVTTVVLDEADRMADMGFLPDVRQLLDATSSDRQTLLFSATLDGDVDRLVDRYQRDPAIHDVVPADTASGRVDHLFWQVEPADRVRTTAEIVDRLGSTIVFCRTKHGVDRVARQLGQWNVKAAAIHGDRSQGQRQKALDDFEAGKVAALVATDVAARGIHVDDVGAVVHFDPPADHKDYRHRSGRTGRAGRDGTVITLVVAKMAPAVSALQLTLGLPEVTSPNGTWPGDLRPDVPAPGDVGGVAVTPSRLAVPMSRTEPQAEPR